MLALRMKVFHVFDLNNPAICCCLKPSFYIDMRVNLRTGPSTPSGTSSNTPGISFTKVAKSLNLKSKKQYYTVHSSLPSFISQFFHNNSQRANKSPNSASPNEPPKEYTYITRRTDSNPHRLTKSPLTQPFPACSAL